MRPYEEWIQRCSEGLDILTDQREHAGPDGDFDGVSIVSYRPEGSSARNVEFMQWIAPGVSGRVATLDEQRHVKAIVPVGPRRLPIPFAELDGTIICRDKKARHVKAQWKKNQDQSKMPDQLLRLLDMFRLAEDTDPARRTSLPNVLPSYALFVEAPIRSSCRWSLHFAAAFANCASTVPALRRL